MAEGRFVEIRRAVEDCIDEFHPGSECHRFELTSADKCGAIEAGLAEPEPAEVAAWSKGAARKISMKFAAPFAAMRESGDQIL